MSESINMMELHTSLEECRTDLGDCLGKAHTKSRRDGPILNKDGVRKCPHYMQEDQKYKYSLMNASK